MMAGLRLAGNSMQGERVTISSLAGWSNDRFRRLWISALKLSTCWVGGVFAEPCTMLEGDAIQGGMLRGQTLPSAMVTFEGISVPVLPDGTFLLGLGRDMASANTLTITTKATCVQEVAVTMRE